jgi:hypothetical protein
MIHEQDHHRDPTWTLLLTPGTLMWSSLQASVDGVYTYQTSYGFASGQIHRRSQRTLLPLSVRTQSIESVDQCATQGFNIVKQRKLYFGEPSCI